MAREEQRRDRRREAADPWGQPKTQDCGVSEVKGFEPGKTGPGPGSGSQEPGVSSEILGRESSDPGRLPAGQVTDFWIGWASEQSTRHLGPSSRAASRGLGI